VGGAQKWWSGKGRVVVEQWSHGNRDSRMRVVGLGWAGVVEQCSNGCGAVKWWSGGAAWWW